MCSNPVLRELSIEVPGNREPLFIPEWEEGGNIMYLVNTGSIQASKNVTEVAKILVEEGIYSSLDRVPIYDSKEIGIEEF